ncbi:Bcr/CflA family efflux MFS transporter [Roseobacter sp. HKCCD9010]|uniref:multidrug effflux MFS transporter n=1 Tax=unclassified Roseobacter TaxID=196798 RepID=UPI001491C62A|nr:MULTISPECIES: multidrug effflux MFS transporter [unclassified Roseobacter]MBF9049177.1 Bcr/CflA family efflux MFS transporter [Rhodobacterales bacterium HKCCD4356]NNV11177.1 Bcr/CflA family efflux MFS transporter [Roseobacter sp. HKCCD7357]NNV15361.1 Bcr/CflA family efflux MFS transporter [Roseobacter sp. HKCCD8768]NNV24821.1 Bcr/CflA family efflux MFS transporter [Roseobacter sp. HKCCD8192]NNV29077.1 Bcr/CflA family efflux MFS transporter [Roseobacter sp. HKCCD9061]
MSSRPTVRFLDRTTPPHIFTLIVLTGLGALSMNLFLPSLPNMSVYFDTDYRVMQLSVAGYLGMNAVLQLIVGPISDRYGRRPVLLWGLGIFILATIGCVFATTVEIFLVFRMIQATVVVGMVLGRAVVRDMVPQEEAASMIGYVTMGMAIVPMIGPVFGGIMDETLGWQSTFWLLAILGIMVWALIWRDLGETVARKTTSFRAQFAEYPELLASRRFWGYCLAAAFASGAFFAYLGGAPYVGSEVFGLSPAMVGFFFGAPAVGYFFGNFVSGRYSVRVGINAMILWGAIISATGVFLSLLFFLGGVQTAPIFFGFMTFVGLGNGMVLPNATSGMLSVRPHLAGTASGLGGAFMIGGGAALSALAGTLLTEGRGAFPLIWIMLITALLAVASILYTIRRERQVSGL